MKRGQQVWVKVLSIQGTRLSLSMRDVDQATGKDLLPGARAGADNGQRAAGVSSLHGLSGIRMQASTPVVSSTASDKAAGEDLLLAARAGADKGQRAAGVSSLSAWPLWHPHAGARLLSALDLLISWAALRRLTCTLCSFGQLASV